MGIAQKYIRSTQSSNLRCDDRHFDADTLMAVALCGVPFGPLLLRARLATTESNPSAVYELKRVWLGVVAKTAFIKSWPSKISAKKVASTSIEYWMNDVCPDCFGRKSDQIDNTPCLTGVDCKSCAGTGKRPIPCDAEHAPYVLKMVYDLDGIALSASCGASAKSKKS